MSSSANTREILDAAGIADRFETVVDGRDVADRGLKGKPAPDTFLRGREATSASSPRRPPCSRTRSPASRPAAPATSGRSWASTAVGQADALREHGADVVVEDLAELLESRMIGEDVFPVDPWSVRETDARPRA